MPNFDSNDPRQFGWDLGFRGFVPFNYHGFAFPQGVHPAAVHVFTTALDRLIAAGLSLPPVSMGFNAGMWGQEDRTVKDGSAHSFHQFGLAIDVCAPWNPWRVANPDPSPYRLPDNTSTIVEPLGLLWGGSPRFGTSPDRMHLEVHAWPSELGAPLPVGPPSSSFPLPAGYYYGPYSGPAQSISGAGVGDGPFRAGLERIQTRLAQTPDGLYGPLTASAIRSWQARHGLVVDGLAGPNTWRSLFG